MLRITIDNGGTKQILHAESPESTQRVTAGQLKEKVNTVPALSATVTPQSLCYGALHDRVTTAELLDTRTGEIWFEGCLLRSPESMTSAGLIQKKLVFEGFLSYLNDSVQPYHHYEDTDAAGFLQALLTYHNSVMPEHKHITLGTVNISGDTANSKTTAYRSTLAEIKENLISRLGGEIRVRRANGVLVLDYLSAATAGATTGITVTLGRNMKSMSVEADSASIVTRIMPLGAKVSEDTAERLTIEGAVIEGTTLETPYIEDTNLVQKYGIITGVVEFDGITVKENLYDRGVTWLQENSTVKMHYSASVLDVSGGGSLVVGNTYKFVHPVLGLNENLRLLGRTVDILKPYTPQVEIGDKFASISDIVAKTQHAVDVEIPQQISGTVEAAKDIASALINSATTGYVVLRPNEILIMDTDDVETATSVWRWNSGGLGYSHSDTPGAAYSGTYGTAITMNGQIVADFIAAGYLYADRIRGGTLRMGGANNQDGVIEVADANDNIVCRLNKDGAYIFGTVFTRDSSGYWLELANGNLSGGNGNNTYTVLDSTAEVTDVIEGVSHTYRGMRVWAEAVSFENCKHIGVHNGSTGYIGLTDDIVIPEPAVLNVQTQTLEHVAIIDPSDGSFSYVNLTYVSGVTVTSGTNTLHIEKGLVTA